LKPSNSAAFKSRQTKSDYPPWHPNYGRALDEDDSEEEADAAQASGVDLADSCVPPVKMKKIVEKDSEESSRSSSEEETARTMTKSRVRRGSEGYEVRPKRYEVAYAAFDDQEDEDERDKLGFDEYNDEEEDDREWDWQRRQEEEDKLREMIEEDMRASGPIVSHDPPADWQTDSTSILLPSQVMRRRSQWQDFVSSNLNDD
jgi:hypothetical protein